MKSYQEAIFGTFQGQDIVSYTFENDLGYRLKVMTYGATVLEYVTPDKQGQFANIVVGFDNFTAYVGNSPKYGASVGPVAGRIAKAEFDLNGENYQLEVNNAENCNHSGSTGWDSAIFQVEEVTNEGVTFYTERADGTGGFPGNLKVWVSYTLTELGELGISYQVQTDKDTLVNPTNHSYFNLSGDFSQPIDNCNLQLNILGVFPIAPDGVPAKVADSNRNFVKDLTKGVTLKDIFANQDEQIQIVSGLDHPFALNKQEDRAGSLYEPKSGRFLTFKTSAPCLVTYSANFVDDTVILNGQPMIQHNGLALETQALPDAIHSDLKTDVILKAGEIFTSTTIYHATSK
ncbi:Aldose 1-epimerase precursor [Streptococcus constellatus]|uniref:Aldose 1-epimerase n=1 Tax=Streptococcus constellatus TaxID=76860 RepID=A0A564SSB2_STRCV|nr:aldose epimerase family protein [Streptococcus constellatus]VUW91561.1 Aldose 1-epimerase precursor [Streptococcus gordonii]VUW98086.1 Aldose 1-epimerase precursor [Streptococcus constellatus]